MTDSTNLRHKDWESMPDDMKQMVIEGARNWRSWGSWFSWGSPVGLGLFFIEIGVFLWVLHLAGLIR